MQLAVPGGYEVSPAYKDLSAWRHAFLQVFYLCSIVTGKTPRATPKENFKHASEMQDVVSNAKGSE